MVVPNTCYMCNIELVGLVFLSYEGQSFLGTAQEMVQAWTFDIPENKSLQLSFDDVFGLPNSSFLTVYYRGNNTLGANKTKIVTINGKLPVGLV